MFLICVAGSEVERSLLRVPPVHGRSSTGGDRPEDAAGTLHQESHRCWHAGQGRGRPRARLNQLGQARVQKWVPPGRISQDCQTGRRGNSSVLKKFEFFRGTL